MPGPCGARRTIPPARSSGTPDHLLGGCVVLPCTQDFFGYYTLGNVKDASIREIWNNEKMITLREKVLARDIADLETCSKCDRLWRPKILGIPRQFLGRALRKSMN